MVFIGIGSLVSHWGQYTFLSLASVRQSKKLREAYLKAMLKQDITWFDKSGAGALVQRITGYLCTLSNSNISSDTVIIEDAIGGSMGSGIQFLSTFLTGFIIGFVYGWKLALVLVSVTPLLARTIFKVFLYLYL